MESVQKSSRRTRVGRVIGNSAAKTIAVRVESMIQHPKYKKYLKRSTKFQVHDPEEKCEIGDLVRIEECRKMSKTKNWIVREVIEKADAGVADTISEKQHGHHPKKEESDDSAGISS